MCMWTHIIVFTPEGYGTAEGRAVVVKRFSVENGRTSTQTCLIRVYLLADVNCMSSLCGSGAHRSSLASLSMYLSSLLLLVCWTGSFYANRLSLCGSVGRLGLGMAETWQLIFQRLITYSWEWERVIKRLRLREIKRFYPSLENSWEGCQLEQ